MKTAAWAVALGVAVLWPARLAGPFDGVPLDSALEAIALGVALPAMAWTHPLFLRSTITRALIAALLAWKALTAVATVQDGWCVRFTSPVPLYLDDLRVPHSWDIRADWRATVPRCSAVMTRGYPEKERFPAWFVNLPPADPSRQATPDDRPPNLILQLDVNGYLQADDPGVFSLDVGDGLRLQAAIDGVPVENPAAGVSLRPGTHRVSIAGQFTGADWRLMPAWNGRPLWDAATATIDEPRGSDLALRPWARWITPMLVMALLVTALVSLARLVGRAWFLPVAATAMTTAAALSGRVAAMRVAPLLLLAAAWVPLPRRLHNAKGMMLLVGIPFLAMFAVHGIPQAGLFTWYSSGDDWWMFQRYSYRIYLQGYWLEGGQPTFFYQPFYRWIAGALHLVFGDSSVGELYWDAAGAVVCALFVFRVTRVNAGFRWGLVGAIALLSLMVLGPTWYLFGRGLSEITSAAFLSAAALLAWRGRHGHHPSIVFAGVFAVLAFYTRLNNLPMAIALAAFAWPATLAIATIFRPSALAQSVSRPVLVGMLASIVVGILLFMARTYYYTGIFSLFAGTQAGMLSLWQPSAGSIAGNVIDSVLMVLTMNDPPRADPRALPLITGVLAALGGLFGIGRLRHLPLAAVALCLAGVAGAMVARGTAYSGRFSVALLPVTVVLSILTIALFVRKEPAP